jgi:sialate O-acetylesterase
MATAEVRLPALISDHMVLQQQGPARVWGWASPGERVTVSFAGQSPSTTADATGHWSIWLTSLKPGKSADMTVAGTNKLVVHDVLVGEVWVGSGQSNMERAVHFSPDEARIDAQSKDDEVRLFMVPHRVAEQPVDDVQGKWETADARSIRNFSALLYFFGRDLKAEKHVPVGLIESAYGGTLIESWESRPVLDHTPGLEFVNTEWAATLAKMPQMMADWQTKTDAWKATLSPEDRAKADAGKVVNGAPGKPRGAGSQAEPAGLYNGMIAPITLYTVRGILWNQGENNAGTDAQSYRYRQLFLAMIEDWRRAWGEPTLPFLFAQLSRYHSNGYPMLRESQAQALHLAHTGMMVSIDVGLKPTPLVEDAVHYPDKETLGKRMLRLADQVVYGEPVEGSGPVLSRLTVHSTADGKQALQLWFTETQGGLLLKAPPQPQWATLTAQTPPAQTADGKAITLVPPTDEELARAFMVAGDDGKFVNATVEIDGNTLLLRSEKVPAPVAVCYAWEGLAPALPLWNGAGLPASPFRAALNGRAEPVCPTIAAATK